MITQEISYIMSAYGISVDRRHLLLLSDVMSFKVSVVPFMHTAAHCIASRCVSYTCEPALLYNAPLYQLLHVASYVHAASFDTSCMPFLHTTSTLYCHIAQYCNFTTQCRERFLVSRGLVCPRCESQC
jgi:hypothetical protein